MKAEGGQKWPDSVTVSRRGRRGGEVDQPSTAFHLLQISSRWYPVPLCLAVFRLTLEPLVSPLMTHFTNLPYWS